MSEIPKVSGAKLYLDEQRLHSALSTAGTGMSTQQAVPVEEKPPVVERRKKTDRRKNNDGSGQTPFDTRQKGERRRAKTLDYEV